MEQTEILIKSTIDGTMQPSLFYSASKSKRPLLVSLHTWSYNRFNRIETMVPFAENMISTCFFLNSEVVIWIPTSIAPSLAVRCMQSKT